jgi:hypothetical protein
MSSCGGDNNPCVADAQGGESLAKKRARDESRQRQDRRPLVGNLRKMMVQLGAVTLNIEGIGGRHD